MRHGDPSYMQPYSYDERIDEPFMVYSNHPIYQRPLSYQPHPDYSYEPHDFYNSPGWTSFNPYSHNHDPFSPYEEPYSPRYVDPHSSLSDYRLFDRGNHHPPSDRMPSRSRRFHPHEMKVPHPIHPAPVLIESPHAIIKGDPHFNMIKLRVEEAVRMKAVDVMKAEELLERLTHEFPTCHLVWIELSRLELDQGNLCKCREVLLKGLEYLPRDEHLLEKCIRMEERLRNVEGVVDCANALYSIVDNRSVKHIVEAAIVVAKMGHGYKASQLFNLYSDCNFLQHGGVALDYTRFVFKTEDYDRGLEKLQIALNNTLNYGPIWFFTFSVLEQNHTIRWCRKEIRNRCNNKELTRKIEQALKCLESKFHWKIYYIAAQAQLRSFTHIRLWARTWKRYLQEYNQYYPGVIRLCLKYLKLCVRSCEQDFKWKVWLLAGRVEALAGNTKNALQVISFTLCDF